MSTMFKENESKDSNKFIFTILIVVVIFISLLTGAIYYFTKHNETSNPSNDGDYKPPTIYNSPVIVRNNLSTNVSLPVQNYAILNNRKNDTMVIYPQNRTYKRDCCYPKECDNIIEYNKSSCDNSCVYPIQCFTLKENQTIEQYLQSTRR